MSAVKSSGRCGVPSRHLKPCRMFPRHQMSSSLLPIQSGRGKKHVYVCRTSRPPAFCNELIDASWPSNGNDMPTVQGCPSYPGWWRWLWTLHTCVIWYYKSDSLDIHGLRCCGISRLSLWTPLVKCNFLPYLCTLGSKLLFRMHRSRSSTCTHI